MAKTLRVAFPVAETGFDPQATADLYSWSVLRAIVDPLYVYDYFARPVRLVPNTAAALPEVTDGGRTYTIKVKPGIHFAADPAFKGKLRELTAEDYVYSIKRIFDPKVRSYWVYVFENNLAGLDDVLAGARKNNTFDYDARIEGLQAIDRYTLQIRFRRPNYGFEWWFTSVPFSAVAREVVDAYKDSSNRVMENPVGTGAYRLKDWTRGQHIVLEANPGYREVRFPAPGPAAPRRMPRSPRDWSAARCRWWARSTSASSRRRSRACSRSTRASSISCRCPPRCPPTCCAATRSCPHSPSAASFCTGKFHRR